MKRKIEEALMKWKNEDPSSALMMIGPRQVGKTYSLRQFCQENFDDYIYVNLERDHDIAELFDQSIDPKYLVQQIGLLMGKSIIADKTAIVIDEIQVSERAIVSLKYFAESDENYYVLTAGSLLGVALNRFKASFPVGKVHRVYMYPLDFEEFLWALNREVICREIEECILNEKPLSTAVHNMVMNMYKDYLYVGGMPASVNDYLKCEGNLQEYNRNIKRDILDDYLADMSKYTTSSEHMKIGKIFRSIPKQLGRDSKKFSYKLVDEGANKQRYESSIDWLLNSQICHKAHLIEIPRIPLDVHTRDNIFKLYFCDIGLLCELASLSIYDLNSKESQHYHGMLTESYIATHIHHYQSLYYWRSGNTAEVDFVMTIKGHAIPIEVKASTNTKSKALRFYMEKYKPEYAIKVSGKNFGFTEQIKQIPLYAFPIYLRLMS